MRVRRVQQNDDARRRPEELKLGDEAGAGERWGTDGGQYDVRRAGCVIRGGIEEQRPAVGVWREGVAGGSATGVIGADQGDAKRSCPGHSLIRSRLLARAFLSCGRRVPASTCPSAACHNVPCLSARRCNGTIIGLRSDITSMRNYDCSLARCVWASPPISPLTPALSPSAGEREEQRGVSADEARPTFRPCSRVGRHALA